MQKFHMIQRGRIGIFLVIDATLYHVEDHTMSDDGLEKMTAASSAKIDDIKIITYGGEQGAIIGALQFLFTANESSSQALVEGWQDGLVALREAWRARCEGEHREVSVTLDSAALGEAVAERMERAALEDMRAELDAETSAANALHKKIIDGFAGALPPKRGELLAVLKDPLDGDGAHHLARTCNALRGVARVAVREVDGACIGAYLLEREADTARAYLTERGFLVAQVISRIED